MLQFCVNRSIIFSRNLPYMMVRRKIKRNRVVQCKAPWMAGCGSQLTPLKFGAEVRNCRWLLCRTGVKVMAVTTCLTISTTSRDEVKVNVSCYTILLPWTPVEKWFPSACAVRKNPLKWSALLLIIWHFLGSVTWDGRRKF